VAGKTGTTQGNADGWFILMHPQIVAGAWAGFNDARITLRSDQWGQGARSALPMVGDFMSRALHSPLLNAKARFTSPETSHWWSDFVDRLRDRMQQWAGSGDEAPDERPAPGKRPSTSAPTPAPEPAPDSGIEESTPALPPSRAPSPPPADNGEPPDLDTSPGLAPSDGTQPPPGWSDIGTPLPPLQPAPAPSRP
jgi:penicillin-binding protein 1A